MVARTKYQEGTFGAYFANLLKEHNYSQAQFAEDLGVSKTYLFDIFHNRINPPTREKQERIVLLLNLNEQERIEFLDKAAAGREELPKDIVEFLTENYNEIKMLREKMNKRI